MEQYVIILICQNGLFIWNKIKLRNKNYLMYYEVSDIN